MIVGSIAGAAFSIPLMQRAGIGDAVGVIDAPDDLETLLRLGFGQRLRFEQDFDQAAPRAQQLALLAMDGRLLLLGVAEDRRVLLPGLDLLEPVVRDHVLGRSPDGAEIGAADERHGDVY